MSKQAKKITSEQDDIGDISPYPFQTGMCQFGHFIVFT